MPGNIGVELGNANGVEGTRMDGKSKRPMTTWTNRLFVLIITCQTCSSDFNIVLPEICSSVGVDVGWIRESVLEGMPRDVAHRIKIFAPEEVCDGSEGLLKVISVAHSDPSGQMIASLSPHLCPTAATFFHLRQSHFTSWTCGKVPGVLSLKPTPSEVVSNGVERAVVKHLSWRKVAFTKSKSDGSPFCEEIGAALQRFYGSQGESNVSIVNLGNFEDSTHLRLLSTNEIDGVFFCVSYEYALNNYLILNSSNIYFGSSTPNQDRLRRIPTVIIPEWPIPINAIPILKNPIAPTYALIQVPHSSPGVKNPFETDFKSSDISKNGNKNHNARIQKLMETVLVHLILMGIGMSGEEGQIVATTAGAGQRESSSWTPVHGSGGPPLKIQFHFAIVQEDKGRWHPLKNLSVTSPSGGGEPNPSLTSTESHHAKDNDSQIEEEDWITWVQVLIATSAAAAVILSLICISLYARRRSRGSSSYDSTARRKLSRRLRSQGPYKVLLTSKDIVFGTIAPPLAIDPNSTRKTCRSQFGSHRGGGGSGSGSEERPDLLKGSHGTLRKNLSIPSTMKVETNLTGEHRGIRYKGDLVHLKEIESFTEPLQVKMKAMTYLETLHGLRHENLAAMLGCLTEISPGLVWEYCSRGSLHDILQQSDIKLDWAFKLSLLTDLVRGMRYLHLSMIRVHGTLNSSNCVVDARWVLKITNYGINGLLHAQGLPPLERSSAELLWVAPELLRDESLRKHGTQAGDVYSFAIIMQEVLVRGKPYSMLTLTAEEILEKVKRPPPLIRPSVSKGAAPPEAINIMRQCWAELPDMRPDFMVIHDLFKTLNHGRKANIVDTMFQMLEKYSNNLEELIRERTEQLDLERKKTEQLLNRMLPSTVAEKLKMGLPVDPEEFAEVTIYFSDIVGFTTISAYSTPFEVVDLLNDLYTCFDATINDYNVYKVETIGDAYMVVGGAPLWSLDHADQVATMALDLLHQSGKFRIRHLPYTPLRLRIGLHTGPCCAGVVGLTMPRYCLFGDTVNTASRMESTGSAWRIHISRETKTKLDSIGGYIIQYRGMTDIKGKGQLETFWLLGKEGFDKELPKPPGLNESVKLDEKSIQFGRTGKMPDAETVPGNEFGECSTNTNQNLSLPSKPQPKYCVLSGDNLRCLSPAEQVAYQLLNGKPVMRGLRRQFSLDQGANAHPLVTMKSFRKAPSLEDTCDQYQQSTASNSLDFCQGPSTPPPITTSTTVQLTPKSKFQQPPASSPPTTSALETTPTTTSPQDPSQSNSDNNSKTGGMAMSNRMLASTRSATSPIAGKSLPVLEESPLVARRNNSKNLCSTSLDT